VRHPERPSELPRVLLIIDASTQKHPRARA
jgi:hypothetical protein